MKRKVLLLAGMALVMMFGNAQASWFKGGHRPGKVSVRSTKTMKVNNPEVKEETPVRAIDADLEPLDEPVVINEPAPVVSVNVVPSAESPVHRENGHHSFFHKKKRAITPELNAPKSPSREEIRQIKKMMRSGSPSDNQVLEIILAILLPPVAVLVHENNVTTKFWIDLILTLLFWLPGAIYALLVVFNKV